MIEKLQLVENRYEELLDKSQRPDFYNDPKQAAKILKELEELRPIVTAFRDYRKAGQEMDEARELMAEGLDPEMKALCQEEFAAAKARQADLQEQLRLLLLPKDPNDDKSVIMEIRGGVGGEESALFAHSLFRMYQMYADKQHWQVELLNYNETELGGVKEADFIINGRGAWSRLKFESGVHRVQRVPETESSGRIHTSTATVAVLPEAEETELYITPEDLRIDTFRSGGAGGQHVNKTESAIRITHLPTGTVVACQDERSQYKNKDRAMKILRSRLYARQQAESDAAQAARRRSQIGGAERSERIRTYRFHEKIVVDHRLPGDSKSFSLGPVLDGNLDGIIDALTAQQQAEKLLQQANN